MAALMGDAVPAAAPALRVGFDEASGDDADIGGEHEAPAAAAPRLGRRGDAPLFPRPWPLHVLPRRRPPLLICTLSTLA